MSATRIEVDTYVKLLDHIMEEHASAFGADHWHSLARNLSTVRHEDWNARPTGGGRTIRELIIHIGGCFLMYGNHAFGDARREWGENTINGQEPGSSPAELLSWLRATHAEFRNAVAALNDSDLGETRSAPWDDPMETRRVIELMIQHPLYHIGEINHIRALLQGNDDWDHQDMGRND
jgi:uncharacterized damage-inducible protein DinB